MHLANRKTYYDVLSPTEYGQTAEKYFVSHSGSIASLLVGVFVLNSKKFLEQF